MQKYIYIYNQKNLSLLNCHWFVKVCTFNRQKSLNVMYLKWIYRSIFAIKINIKARCDLCEYNSAIKAVCLYFFFFFILDLIAKRHKISPVSPMSYFMLQTRDVSFSGCQSVITHLPRNQSRVRIHFVKIASFIN